MTFESGIELLFGENDIFWRQFDKQLKPILSLLLHVNWNYMLHAAI